MIKAPCKALIIKNTGFLPFLGIFHQYEHNKTCNLQPQNALRLNYCFILIKLKHFNDSMRNRINTERYIMSVQPNTGMIKQLSENGLLQDYYEATKNGQSFNVSQGPYQINSTDIHELSNKLGFDKVMDLLRGGDKADAVFQANANKPELGFGLSYANSGIADVSPYLTQNPLNNEFVKLSEPELTEGQRDIIRNMQSGKVTPPAAAVASNAVRSNSTATNPDGYELPTATVTASRIETTSPPSATVASNAVRSNPTTTNPDGYELPTATVTASRIDKNANLAAEYHKEENFKNSLNDELKRAGVGDAYKEGLANGSLSFTKADGSLLTLDKDQALNAAHVLGARGFAEALAGNQDRIATLESRSGKSNGGYAFAVEAHEARKVDNIAALDAKPIQSVNPLSDQAKAAPANVVDKPTNPLSGLAANVTAGLNVIKQNFENPTPTSKQTDSTGLDALANKYGNDTDLDRLDTKYGKPSVTQNDLHAKYGVGDPATPQVEKATIDAKHFDEAEFKNALEAMSKNPRFNTKHFARAEETAREMGTAAFLQQVNEVNSGTSKRKDIDWAKKSEVSPDEKAASRAQDNILDKASDGLNNVLGKVKEGLGKLDIGNLKDLNLSLSEASGADVQNTSGLPKTARSTIGIG